MNKYASLYINNLLEKIAFNPNSLVPTPQPQQKVIPKPSGDPNVPMLLPNNQQPPTPLPTPVPAPPPSNVPGTTKSLTPPPSVLNQQAPAGGESYTEQEWQDFKARGDNESGPVPSIRTRDARGLTEQEVAEAGSAEPPTVLAKPPTALANPLATPFTLNSQEFPNATAINAERNDDYMKQFEQGTKSKFDPNSRVDREKLKRLKAGAKDWAVRR